jgi:hypothetical protein
MLLKLLHAAFVAGLRFERRFDPFFRRHVDAVLREPLTVLLQAAINAGRRNEDLRLAEERFSQDEEACVQAIVHDMGTYMNSQYRPGGSERAGNTKTHAIVCAEVSIRDDLLDHLRHGIFREPRIYPAWVRFAGPGPDSPPDIDDVGVLSIGIKMMGVPGPKLLSDERYTQDLLGITTPVFTTPDVSANAQLQAAIVRGLPLFYFINLRRPHLLDALMQGLWSRTQCNPLAERYWSCVPYLLGEGQAMQYSVRPRAVACRHIPRLPLRPPDNYLREAMVATLNEQDVEFDILLQLQTDAHRMPIENASVRWPERLSPPVPVATLRIPRQQFDSPEQLTFASRLSFNPWHCVPEHRPLGNQNRARRIVYQELSRLRQDMNSTPHEEPTGMERFDK